MKILEVLGFVDEPKTGMATYDDMMADPEYFADEKNRKHGMVMMDPREYIDRALKGFQREYPNYSKQELIASRDEKLVDKYAQEMKGGDKFPTLTLDYSMGFSQEGLHRALAAIKAGINKVPVMMVSMTRNKVRKGKRAHY